MKMKYDEESDAILVKLPKGSGWYRKVSGLPERKWIADKGYWQVPLHVENFEAMEAAGFPMSHFTRPTRRGSYVSIDKQRLRLKAFPTPHNIKACQTIPGTRQWAEKEGVWRVAPSRENVLHIIEHFPDIEWIDGAERVKARIESHEERVRAALDGMRVSLDQEITDYEFGTTPFDHQLEVFKVSRDREEFALFMEMGTGKTKVIIDTAHYLYQQDKIDAVVVVCPNSIKAVWSKEVLTHAPHGDEFHVVEYSAAYRKQILEETAELVEAFDGLLYFVINVETMSFPSGIEACETVLNDRRTLFVVDESTRIKTPSARRTKNVLKVARLADYRRIMSGAPITQSPLDLYAPMRMLNPDILGFDSVYAFRRRFAITDQIQVGKKRFDQVKGYKNLEELTDLLAPWSYRVKKDECMDLPEKIFVKRYVEMTQRQAEAYRMMRDFMIAQFDATETVTAPIVLTQMLRLQQIVGGWVKFEDVQNRVDGLDVGEATPEPIDPKGNPRLDAVVDLAEETDGKMIVWARFRPEIDGIAARLREEFGEGSVVEMHGGVPAGERGQIVEEFQGNDEVRFFVGNQSTGGLGLTLTAASVVVYYSNSFSLEERLQSEDRAHRAGLKHNVTYVDLVCEDTIDETLIDALRGKKQIADLVTGDGWQEWL